MLNQIYAGETINVIAPAGGFVAGRPHLLGSMVVVPKTNAVAGAQCAVQRGGAVRVPKNVGTAFATPGALVEWDPTPGEVVTNAGGSTNWDVGYVLEPALSADTTIVIALLVSPSVAN